MVGIGYRYEKWQPMVTYSKYWVRRSLNKVAIRMAWKGMLPLR